MTPFHDSIHLKVDYEESLEFSSSVFSKNKVESIIFI